jgi:CBS-domain-containing membrane protein
MNRDVATISPDANSSRPLRSCEPETEKDVLPDAAKLLADHHIRRLLVFDRDKNLLGLLSLDDLAAIPADWDCAASGDCGCWLNVRVLS